MLCAGVVHGDFSDFNVLVGADGPVIIDFPQSVDTAHNTSARKLLLRDVDNMHRFLSTFAPHARRLPYAEEMWDLFQQNAITPDTRLTGRYRPSERRANTHAVLELIQDANYDERKRRESLGLRGGPEQARSHPPAWNGASRNPQPRNGPPRNGPPPNRPQANRSQPDRSQPNRTPNDRPQPTRPQAGRRDEGRTIEVIAARRPPR
jgi:RIO kinase 1